MITKELLMNRIQQLNIISQNKYKPIYEYSKVKLVKCDKETSGYVTITNLCTKQELYNIVSSIIAYKYEEFV